jgi:hydroxyacylglutathione hydrolase
MSLIVHQFPCLEDNYGYLVREESSGHVACIDTPDARRILEELQRLNWRLTHVLNTHWHPDHAGGNAEIKQATNCIIVGPQEVTKIAPIDQLVEDGHSFQFDATRMEVMGVGGHTLGHIAYYAPAERMAFVGDVLFPMGCGRLFEGTPEQMWNSLKRIAALPGDTTVYSAHEYTAGNARFALTVDDIPEVRARANEVFSARQRGEPTVPTTIDLERATNPFLRAPQIAARLGMHGLSDADAFAHVRKAKDSFSG